VYHRVETVSSKLVAARFEKARLDFATRELAILGSAENNVL